MVAKGPNIPHALHKGDKEIVGYQMAQEKLARETQALAEAAATSDDLTALDARVTALENPPPSVVFTSPDQTITASTVLTLAHGLSAIPAKFTAKLICQAPDQGYAAGDVLQVSTNLTFYTIVGAGSIFFLGCSVSADATNVTIAFTTGAAGQFFIANKTTGAGALITNASWKLQVIAEP